MDDVIFLLLNKNTFVIGQHRSQSKHVLYQLKKSSGWSSTYVHTKVTFWISGYFVSFSSLKDVRGPYVRHRYPLFIDYGIARQHSKSIRRRRRKV